MLVFQQASTGTDAVFVSTSKESDAVNYWGLGEFDGNYGVTSRAGNGVKTVVGSTAVDTNPHILFVVSNDTAHSIYVDGNDETERIVAGANDGDWPGDIAGRLNFAFGGLKHTSETALAAVTILDCGFYNWAMTDAARGVIERSAEVIHGITLS